jgi:hypothetical protein
MPCWKSSFGIWSFWILPWHSVWTENYVQMFSLCRSHRGYSHTTMKHAISRKSDIELDASCTYLLHPLFIKWTNLLRHKFVYSYPTIALHCRYYEERSQDQWLCDDYNQVWRRVNGLMERIWRLCDQMFKRVQLGKLQMPEDISDIQDPCYGGPDILPSV